MLVGNRGDGVNVSTKAARVMKELYGIELPGFKYTAHAADSSLKCTAKSETMSGEEVK